MTFNYNAAAELFPSRRVAKSQQTQYRRFAKAAEAIRFCMEELPEAGLGGTILEVRGGRFDGQAIKALYEAEDYPLPRQEVAA
tara:strand:- start:3196 stop:3444 length:249 start_codon:yes stop_codon:yes gene_type:complete